ncbi:unnamed protein product [Cylicocyclus nassatus]|uniref:Ubiquitin carboxyl-terminal hydrolase n=1 Tax=Cylicocyclus nassatus TaxID=53992 RepID=A0AA36GXQ4_CYLNA|nr:unnamed protein product [Cylicocyclus nassatus]
MPDPNGTRAIVATGAILGGTVLAAFLYYQATKPRKRQGSKPAGVPGLRNLGNTCYANALLQGISSLPSMVRWLKEIDTSTSELKCGFLDELKEVVLKLNDGSTELYDVGGVMAALAKHKWNITLGVEHDLHELLNVFATTWEEELQATKRRLLSSSLWQFNETNDSSSSQAAAPSYGDAPCSPASRKELVFKRCADIVRVEAKLRAPCFGLTATELRCCQTNCGFKKVRYDTFGVISLTIPKMFMGIPVTIEALLRKYFCMEVIRGATCDRCKTRNGKRDSGLFKKQGFSKLPQSLIIRIERVGVLPSGNEFKLADHVEFGETLDVRDLCFYRNKEAEYDLAMSRRPESTSRIVGGAASNERQLTRKGSSSGLAAPFGIIDGGSFVAERRESARYKYQLRAVSEHRGVPQSGHFITYRRGIHDQFTWHLTNDAKVERVPYSQVAAAQAYMLYYERILPNRWYKQSSVVIKP